MIDIISPTAHCLSRRWRRRRAGEVPARIHRCLCPRCVLLLLLLIVWYSIGCSLDFDVLSVHVLRAFSSTSVYHCAAAPPKRTQKSPLSRYECALKRVCRSFAWFFFRRLDLCVLPNGVVLTCFRSRVRISQNMQYLHIIVQNRGDFRHSVHFQGSNVGCVAFLCLLDLFSLRC